jgi:pimeloyl-ACP methyl ester carboxylesterase
MRTHARVPSRPADTDATDVVLVHGLGVSSRYMAPLAVRLVPQFRTIAPDLPGFGRSEKPSHSLGLDELADALAGFFDVSKIDRAAIVANSFGCQIAARFALRHSDRVTRMVLQGPTTDPHASVPKQIARWLLDGREELVSLNLIIARDYLECGLRRLIETYLAGLSDPLREELTHIGVPTLVVRGEHDRIVTTRWAEEVARLLPNAELRIVAGAAHAMNYSVPDLEAAAIVPFLLGEIAPKSRENIS